jgi:uncharacterized protein (TIGR02186 family)
MIAPMIAPMIARSAALLLALALPAAAQESVVGAVSQNEVAITADFDGSSIFVFGAVKRMSAADPALGPLDVVVVVSGPPQRLAVRRKERQLGIYVNAKTVEVDEAPAFYVIASSGPLEAVMSATERQRHRIGYDEAVRIIGETGRTLDPETYAQAAVRLREREGIYARRDSIVDLQEETLFSAEIALPAKIIEGDYRVRMFLLRDRRVVTVAERLLSVRKVGLGRLVFSTSRERPLTYGLLSILAALLAGFAASEAFRLLRR